MLQLARPYADEPIAGALVRGCRHFGVPLKQVLSLGAPFGVKYGGSSMPLLGIAPLSFFAELFRMDGQSLLARHTVLPYATTFAERDVWNRAVVNSLSPESNPKTMGAVIQCAIQGLQQRRLCTTCVSEDIRTLGESYWHLSHQLPGCFVCHLHGDVLRSTSLRIAGASSSCDLPQNCSGRQCVAGPVPDTWRRVASRVAELCGRGLEPPMVRPPTYYRDLAVERGWLRAGRNVNADRLAALLTETFGKSLLTAWRLLPSGSAGWASLMLHPKAGTPFSTLKHVLIEQFLGGPVVDLSHKPSGPAARSRTAEDKAYTAAVRRVAAGYTEKGERARIADVLTQAGCWHPYRHAAVGRLPQLSRLVKSLQTSKVAHRPQALQMLAVPDASGEEMTRQDLVKAGHLLSSKDAAKRLGIHWYRMKPMQRDGKILSVRFAARDWYPAFWFDGRIAPEQLAAVYGDKRSQPLTEQWEAMVDCWRSAKDPTNGRLGESQVRSSSSTPRGTA